MRIRVAWASVLACPWYFFLISQSTGKSTCPCHPGKFSPMMLPRDFHFPAQGDLFAGFDVGEIEAEQVIAGAAVGHLGDFAVEVPLGLDAGRRSGVGAAGALSEGVWSGAAFELFVSQTIHALFVF